jgi:hypothetical protein
MCILFSCLVHINIDTIWRKKKERNKKTFKDVTVGGGRKKAANKFCFQMHVWWKKEFSFYVLPQSLVDRFFYTRVFFEIFSKQS